MATSGSKSIAATPHDTLKFSWSRTSYSVANNTSTISWKMQLIADDYGRISSSASKDWSVTVNGTKYSGTNTISMSANTTITLASGSTTITHNTDGTKTFSYSFSQEIAITWDGTYIGTKSGSGSGTLDSIPRQATLTSAPNFTSAQAPVIKYSNPAGSGVTSLEACISLTGATDDIPYRAVSKTGTSYTFNLTTAEMNTLKNATTGNSRTVYFYLKTVIGSSTYYSYLAKTFTIVNGAPTLSPTVRDTNSTTIRLTGDSSKLIKGYSNAYYLTGAAATNGATISSQSCTNNGIKKTTSSGTFNSVGSGTFIFSVTDSRGNTTTQEVTKTFINYFKPTYEIKGNLTTDGDLTITVSGNFFNSSFGSVSNTIIVAFDVWASDETAPSTVPVYTPTVSGNTFTYTYTASGLDYKKTYSVYAHVKDELVTTYNGSFTLSSTPVFDWGEDGFNVNVPISMEEDIVLRRNEANTVLAANGGHVYIRPSGDTDTTSEFQLGANGEAKLNANLTTTGNVYSGNCVTAENYLWSKGNTYCYGDLSVNGNASVGGTITINGNTVGTQTLLASGINKFMHGTQSYSLSGTSALSKQLNGYVLVWSYYSGGTTYINCTNYTFMPKCVLNYNNGYITMPVAMDDGTCGAKSFIVTETDGTTKLQGVAANGTAPNNTLVLSKIMGY